MQVSINSMETRPENLTYYGKLGWEAVGIVNTSFVSEIKVLLKREIQEKEQLNG